ncbi:hypothetical protein, partial [Sphingomonas solaris]|uniref:hypothetical protein n=1 Tax=Alterirhizorhabdus solaris TaxID=2529389 RepID=UPI00193991C5
MRKFTPIAAAVMMVAAAPAFAQAAPAAGAAAPATAPTGAAPAAGQTVFDTAGGEVGKITKVDAGNVVIATGTHEVALPVTSFATGPRGPIIAMTKVQLDAAAAGAAAEAKAKTAAAITAGASVKDTAGAAVGTIKSVDGQYALLDTTKVQVKLPITAFAAQGDGLVIAMTKAQIEAAAAGAGAGAKAKTAAAITAGASVKDTAGAAVGTIKSVDGQYALLDTT